MEIVLSSRAINPYFTASQKSIQNKNSVSVRFAQNQGPTQPAGSNSREPKRNRSLNSRLLRAGVFFIGSFAILALLHKRMIKKSKKLACQLGLISAAIAIIHSIPHNHSKKVQ